MNPRQSKHDQSSEMDMMKRSKIPFGTEYSWNGTEFSPGYNVSAMKFDRDCM